MLNGKKTSIENMSSKPKIIVITGAESTGKSTLTEALSKHFNAPFIPEIARDYVEKLNDKIFAFQFKWNEKRKASFTGK